MTDAPAWPEWLPPAIAEYAEHLLAGRTAQLGFELPLDALSGPVVSVVAGSKGCGRLHRLTHDPRMKRAWSDFLCEMRQVATVRCAPERIEPAVRAWLRGYLLKALTGDIAADLLAGTPNLNEQREMAERIGALAREVLGLLDDPCACHRFTPWNLLDAGARSARAAPAGVQHLFQEFVAASRDRYWSGSDTATFWSLGARPILGDLREMLGALANLADWSIAGESFERAPSKIARFNASIYVREINHYLAGLGIVPRPDRGREKGFPLHQLIAITANVALSSSRKLNADFVRRHLAGRPRKIPS